MKKCIKCGLKKPKSEFFWRNKKAGRLRSECKKCTNEQRSRYHKKHYAKYREEYIARATKRRSELKKWLRGFRKSLSCSLCGDDRWYVLDFHHEDAADKEMCVVEMAHRGCSKKRILEEMKKCVVVCANCHREIHHGDAVAERLGT